MINCEHQNIFLIALIISLAGVILADNCAKNHYRTLDGTCNNLQNSHWGAAGSTYGRLLSAKYGDGISTTAKSVTGDELPSSRLISTKLFQHKDVPDPRFTIVMMQFGQFVAHDMSLGGTTEHSPCCVDGKVSSHEPHCFSILVPPDDPVRGADGMECISFQRTLTDHDSEARNSNGSVKQITVVTGYLDLSLIYGNSEAQLTPIRSYTGGCLKMDEVDGKKYPPQNPDGDKICFVESPGETCFLGGDPRLNQSPDLSILHIFYIREHNRLADILSKLNPQWSDEKVFQEARRINIAQYQYVVYYEWLPLFLGEEQMRHGKLIYNKSGSDYVNDYDATINPAPLSEHSSSAFRYYHSSIEGRLDLLGENRQCTKSVKLSDAFMRPTILQQDDNYDSFGRGMATQSFQKADTNFDIEVKEFLLKHLRKFGDDIRAIDMQRGRDHGINGYNNYRELCGRKKAEKWEDLLDVMSEFNIEKLKSVYTNIDDVELSVGGIFEEKIPGTLAGEVYHCIFMKQFYNTRVGDRYWFETEDADLAFKPNQLAEIRKSSMARMFCDNGNNISSMQPRAFEVLSDDNPVVPCSEIPAVDYDEWKSGKKPS